MTAADRIAELIEHTFTRPEMYAQNPGELEMILLTAMDCWQLTDDGCDRGVLNRWWREEVSEACNAVGYENKSVARLADLIPNEPMGEPARRRRVIRHLRRVWRKLQSPVDRLGAIGRSDA